MLGESRGEHGLASRGGRLLADLPDAAHQHVIDETGVDSLSPDQRGEHLREQVHGVGPRQRSGLLAAAHGGPHGVDDHGSWHVMSPIYIYD
ncbi:hypothetical protein GCM10012289_65500 [Nonomuraea cavernae]|uniref:Uncharacterized protein n=1 Tax=Nonomuraea cavernae TaxID=2045107 RepID=A0A918DQE6_9ACTN|nr:hypothetical protein GCM10012289_65500 [Nonomuraea cavernae]